MYIFILKDVLNFDRMTTIGGWIAYVLYISHITSCSDSGSDSKEVWDSFLDVVLVFGYHK